MDTAIALSPEKVAGIMAFIDENTVKVKSLVVNSPATLAEATDVGQKLKQAITRLEAMRKAVVAPLNAKVTEVNSRFKYFSEPLLAAKGELNEKMVAWQRAEMRREEEARLEAERKAQEEQDRIDAERAEAEAKIEGQRMKLMEVETTKAQALKVAKMIEEEQKRLQELADLEAGTEIALNMVEPPKKTTRTASGAKATFKEVWNFRVVDDSAIPRDYLTLDTSAVRTAMGQGVREIPGIEIFKDLRLSQ